MALPLERKANPYKVWLAEQRIPPSPSEIYRCGNVENDWNSSVVRRWPSKAIIGFPIISNTGSAAFRHWK